MDGLGGVEEVRWSAGGAKGRGDLAGDDATFADAGDDDAALGCRCCDEMIDGLGEGCEHGGVEAEGEFLESGGLDAHEGRRAKVVGQRWGLVGHGFLEP